MSEYIGLIVTVLCAVSWHVDEAVALYQMSLEDEVQMLVELGELNWNRYCVTQPICVILLSVPLRDCTQQHSGYLIKL